MLAAYLGAKVSGLFQMLKYCLNSQFKANQFIPTGGHVNPVVTLGKFNETKIKLTYLKLSSI
jgi:hypothetical protein